MSCPDPKSLEELVVGTLTTAKEDAIRQHLLQCVNCSQKVAFLWAIQRGLPRQLPASADASPYCLSDEALCALLDNVMQPGQRRGALTHLMRCERCMAGFAALGRALEQSAADTVEPAAQLIERAIRIGVSRRSVGPAAEIASDATETSDRGSKPFLFDRIFRPSLAWRLTLAGSVAGLVLLLVFLLSRTTPDRLPSQTFEQAETVVATRSDALDEAEQRQGAKTDPGDVPRSVGEKQPDGDQRPDGERPPARGGTGQPGAIERDWLAALTTQDRLGLAARLQPSIRLRPRLSNALTEQERHATFSDGYALGRAVGFLKRFGNQAGGSVKLRKLIAEVLLSIEPAIRSAMTKDDRESTDRLCSFANELGNALVAETGEPGSALRRLGVFTLALGEALSDRRSVLQGYRLGLLVQGWQTTASAHRADFDAPLYDATALRRARRIVRSEPSLPEHMRKKVLDDLAQIGGLQKQAETGGRAERILNEIDQLDEAIRSSR